MSKPITTEAARITVILILSMSGGLLLDRPWQLLSAGLLLYLGWHLLKLVQLTRLLEKNQALHPPFPSGLWALVYKKIWSQQQRAQKRKRRLSRVFTRFREAATILPDAAVILDEQGKIEWCNPATHQLLGLKWPQTSGERFTHRVNHPVLSEYLSAGDFTRPLKFHSPVDKQKVLSLLITPFGKHLKRYLVIVRDITQVYNLNQTRKDFVANVSHELRTPLTVVSGFLENMEEADTIADSWLPSIKLMRQQAKRMEDTISDLLVLSRLEMNEKKPEAETVPVAQLVENTVEDAKVLSGEAKHRFSLDTDPELQLLGAEKELRTAFSNLIFNAVRHTPGGSEIHISWRGGPEGASLSVRDTGEGIPPRHIPRLTERFYRVDNARSRESGGTGLGLAIVKHIISRHDGELLITSKEGKGSTFSCRFPSSRILIGS